jgi:hypothetical protein
MLCACLPPAFLAFAVTVAPRAIPHPRDFGECELIFVARIRGSEHGQERSQNYLEAPTMSICFLKRR